MAYIGYARVSTEDQNLDRQLDALKAYGCTRIFEEKISGKKKDREQLNAMFDYLRDGEDTVVVVKLDRLARSMKDLLELTEKMSARDIGFISIGDNIDMDTATGRLQFHLMASLAEFERDLIAERTREGLEAAKRRGKFAGRPKTDEKVLERAMKLAESGDYSIAEICEMNKISESTFYRYKRANQS